MEQCKYCGSEVKEGMHFCGNCGALQEAEAAETEVTVEKNGEIVERSVAVVAEESVMTDTEESTVAGQEAHGEDRNPVLTVTVEGVTEETAVIIAGENTVIDIGESMTAGQEASDEAMHLAVPRPSVETSGEPVTTTAGGDPALPTPAAGAVGEPVATAAEENVVTGTEKIAAAGQEASGETAKRKPRRLRAALFAAVTVMVTAVDATVLPYRMTAMTGRRFIRVQAKALRQEAALLEGLNTISENGFLSDSVLGMQMSRSKLLALSRSDSESYMLAAKALQRGIRARVDLRRHLETIVLNLELGTGGNTKLNFDCLLDSEKFGYRIPQTGKQVFVLNYPEVLRQYSGEAHFNTAKLATLISSKALPSASATRCGCVLTVAFRPKEIEIEKRAYISHALKRQLDHEVKGEYTVYTRNPDRGTLETLFRSLAAEMREDKDFADQYNRQQEAGEKLATALGVGRDRAAHFSDVVDYVGKYATD